MASSSDSQTGLPRGRLLALLIGGVIAAAVIVGLAALATQDPPTPPVTAAVDRSVSDPLPGQPPIVVPPVAGAPTAPEKRVAWAVARREATPGIEA
ncbi:MAG: hypothetical protein JHC83_07685, partial [Thermoleophilia bacterium]|nr:hypothetical protein [Thermoleophilia bacterium]